MLKKLTNQKGFTLMEMLIVVAIIAVLVAIAIPAFGGALTKAKEATDVANIRAEYAEYQVAVLNETNPTWENPHLNYPDKFKKEDNKLTYTSTKLDGGNNTDTKVYTWELSE